MADLISTFELPAGRQSHYIPNLPLQDIHDPNWIPVLNNDYRKHEPSEEKEVSPYNHSGFSALPARTTSLESPVTEIRPKLTHSYSKSSLAPESITLEHSPLPPLPSTRSVAKVQDATALGPTSVSGENTPRHGRTSGNGSLDDDRNTTGSETAGESTSAPSTVGTTSLIEEQQYSLPAATSSKQPAVSSVIAHSSRSSIASARKSTATIVPTSKYSRKPVPSLSRSIITLPSRPQTPPDSPKMMPTDAPSLPPSQYATPSATPLIGPPPPRSVFDIEPPPDPPQPNPRHQSVKSTFSQRKQRALHSHPSNISLKSKRTSTSDEDGPPSKAPSVYLKPRKSTDSRMTGRSSLFDSHMPSPAPTTPLPELPPKARRPSIKESSVKPLPAPVPALPSPKSNDHLEMASFMTTTNKVVFRRFDEVHVRLLLCLQDEISQLERDLIALDNATMSKEERSSERTRLMSTLRRVVAEYDHLFANWSSMKANTASGADVEDLKQWLEKPVPGALVLSRGAADDLYMLEKSNDLSTVSLNPKATESGARKSVDTSATTSKQGGGFAALFSCATKRK